MAHSQESVLAVLKRNLYSAWLSHEETYRATTAEDVSFFEWYVSPYRIDGIDCHLRELQAERALADQGAPHQPDEGKVTLEIVQPRVQIYGETAIATYMLLIREIDGESVRRRLNNQTRVFHNLGGRDAPEWKLVHCHKSPIVTAETLGMVQG